MNNQQYQDDTARAQEEGDNRDTILKPSDTKTPSLFHSPSTHPLAKFSIPLLCFLAHVLFLHGQTAVMWRLETIEDVNVWVNATSTAAKSAMDTLGLPHENHILLNDTSSIRTFTFGSAIRELWKATHLSNTLRSRFICVVIVLCSGIWPHAKLLWLNYSFLFPAESLQKRQGTLHWSTALGKWSLADILVVCIMLAVLNLEWSVDPKAVQGAIVDQFDTVVRIAKALYSKEEFCSILLGANCELEKTTCRTCEGVVLQAYSFPALAKTIAGPGLAALEVSGGGSMQMAVQGMRGIYSFCLAVVLSILLSLVVDVYERRARKASMLQSNTDALDESTPNDSACESSKFKPLEIADPEVAEAPTVSSARVISYFSMLRFVAPLVVTFLVFWAIVTYTMNRTTVGAIPEVMHNLFGVSWGREYSFHTLAQMTGAAGGWDGLLMSTFLLFILIGPVLRSTMLVAASCSSDSAFRRGLISAIDFIGAFCAWEVLFLAAVMVDLLMPSLTKAIVQNPNCSQLSKESDSCISIEFTLLQGFWSVFLGGSFLVALSLYEDRRENEKINQEDASYQQLDLQEEGSAVA